MDQKELENGIIERETLDADSRRVVELLSALPRVEAPGNFEFGVKARIAAGEVHPGKNPFGFVKVVAPLALVLVVALFGLFYRTMPSEDVASAPRTETISPQQSGPIAQNDTTPKQSDPIPADTPEPEPMVASGSGSQAATSTGKLNRRSATPRSGLIETPGLAPPVIQPGSIDRAVEAANVIDPPGINSNLGRNSNSNSAGASIPVREVLEMLGVKAEFAGGGWAVRSTADNSIAARAGVKVKDVIEAINDQTLTEDTKLKGSFEGKSLRVRRDGKSMTISLR